MVEGVEKIVVLRAGGLGDFIFTLPALWALRAAYPGAEIALLGGPLQVALLMGRGEPVQRSILVPPSTGVNGPDTGVEEDEGELERFFGRMREERFDLALQMHGGGGQPKSSPPSGTPWPRPGPWWPSSGSRRTAL